MLRARARSMRLRRTRDPRSGRVGGRAVETPVAIWVLAALLATGCGDGASEADTPAPPRLVHEATSAPVPASTSRALAVLGPDRACVFDSYAPAIVCGDRAWQDTVSYGREGAGPDEIGDWGTLLSGPAGSVAFLDGVNNRLALFTPGLEFRRSVRLPGVLIPGDEVRDSVLISFDVPVPGLPVQRARAVSITTGRPVSEWAIRFDPSLIDAENPVVNGGIRGPDGRFLVRIADNGRDWLAWYDSTGAFDALLDLPALPEVHASTRDSLRVEEVFRQRTGGPAPASWVEGIRERPLGFLPRRKTHRMLQVDRSGRAWVLSTRPSETGSYLEVFRGPEHIAALEVAGRVLAFQVADDLLTALVETMEPTDDGLYPRRVEWYRIVAGDGGGSDE